MEEAPKGVRTETASGEWQKAGDRIGRRCRITRRGGSLKASYSSGRRGPLQNQWSVKAEGTGRQASRTSFRHLDQEQLFALLWLGDMSWDKRILDKKKAQKSDH